MKTKAKIEFFAFVFIYFYIVMSLQSAIRALLPDL